MLRLAVIAFTLGACAASARTPAWPKASAKTADGGESLAPHKASPLNVSEGSDDDDIAVIESILDKPVAPKIDDKPAATEAPKPTITAPEDVIIIDDITIDIDD